MKIALAGNPNSGKTTLFNELTKMNQKIGNWPGVTVEKKSGKYFSDKSVEIIDLPGVYSLNPISEDEKITHNYLHDEKLDAIINVIDATNLERSLALTLQLLEHQIPIVLALNMEDELRLHGLAINVEAIERELKVVSILISARKNRNLDKLMEKAIEAANTKQTTLFTSKGKTEEEKAEFRNKYIKTKIDLFRTKCESKSKAKRITERIDSVLLNKWLAFPIFAVIIWLMYFISIQVVGSIGEGALDWLFFDIIGENLRDWLTGVGAAAWVSSLFVDGIIAGAGTVLLFVPQILMLFIIITFLESCGYMSRVSVIMDRLFKKLGLSGKSFVPMIVGTGCTVPAIMSAKTIEGEAERKATIMLAPFIPCSAKLPVFALIAGELFPGNSFVAPSMYFLGILMVIVGGLVLKFFRRSKSNSDSFIIELPHYRFPSCKNMAKEVWNKTKGFVVRAGTVIVVASMVIWFLQSFNFKMQMVDIDESILAYIGKGIAWIFVPLGFGNFESSVALFTGMIAKELVIATFSVLGVEDINLIMTPQAGLAFMAFILLSAPCIAAIATSKREIGSKKWMFIAIGFQCTVAYLTALIINQAGNLWVYDRTLCISIIAGLIVASIFALFIANFIKKRKNESGCSKGCGGCVFAEKCDSMPKEQQ